MKRKLLCMLLSIAMVFTASDSLALAAELPANPQTAAEEPQEETSLSLQTAPAQAESETVIEQESTESDAPKDSGTGAEPETGETERKEEETE